MSKEIGRGRALFTRAVFWAALAFTVIMATLPQPPAALSTPSDKVNHVIAFFVLTALHKLAYRNFGFWKRLLMMAALGGLIELVQMVPALHRDAEWLDWAADVAAALVASCLVSILLPREQTGPETA